GADVDPRREHSPEGVGRRFVAPDRERLQHVACVGEQALDAARDDVDEALGRRVGRLAAPCAARRCETWPPKASYGSGARVHVSAGKAPGIALVPGACVNTMSAETSGGSPSTSSNAFLLVPSMRSKSSTART